MDESGDKAKKVLRFPQGGLRFEGDRLAKIEKAADEIYTLGMNEELGASPLLSRYEWLLDEGTELTTITTILMNFEKERWNEIEKVYFFAAALAYRLRKERDKQGQGPKD